MELQINRVRISCVRPVSQNVSFFFVDTFIGDSPPKQFPKGFLHEILSNFINNLALFRLAEVTVTVRYQSGVSGARINVQCKRVRTHQSSFSYFCTDCSRFLQI